MRWGGRVQAGSGRQWQAVAGTHLLGAELKRLGSGSLTIFTLAHVRHVRNHFIACGAEWETVSEMMMRDAQSWEKERVDTRNPTFQHTHPKTWANGQGVSGRHLGPGPTALETPQGADGRKEQRVAWVEGKGNGHGGEGDR
jgi:hypothetical protein